MPTTRPETLPDRVRLALEVGREMFHAAVRLWVDEGNPLSELALFCEYREGGYVRVRPASRQTLAEYASVPIANEIRRGPNPGSGERSGGATPLFFKPHRAEIAAGQMIWLQITLRDGALRDA